MLSFHPLLTCLCAMSRVLISLETFKFKLDGIFFFFSTEVEKLIEFLSRCDNRQHEAVLLIYNNLFAFFSSLFV